MQIMYDMLTFDIYHECSDTALVFCMAYQSMVLLITYCQFFLYQCHSLL